MSGWVGDSLERALNSQACSRGSSGGMIQDAPSSPSEKIENAALINLSQPPLPKKTQRVPWTVSLTA